MVDEVKNKICYTVNRYAMLIVSLLNPILPTNPTNPLPLSKKKRKKNVMDWLEFLSKLRSVSLAEPL